MSIKLSFILILTIVCLSAICFTNIQQKRIHSVYQQGSLSPSPLSRFKRQTPAYGNRNYMQVAPVQPSVVVMPSGVPSAYRGAGSSYVPPSVVIPNSYRRYGAQGAYGANSPTVIVSMADDI